MLGNVFTLQYKFCSEIINEKLHYLCRLPQIKVLIEM